MAVISNAGDRGERESLIDRAFSDIAAGPEGDAVAAAHALTRWCMRLLDVAGAGVMMADHRGVLRSLVVSSAAVGVLEAAELAHGRGPCVESHRRSRTLSYADVAVVDPRWPEFGTQARAAGMRATHAVPVLHGGTAIGVLNLFRAAPGAFGATDSELARSLADAAGIAMSARAASPAGRDAEQVRAAFTDPALVQRATGMLAVRLEVDLETAGAVLRQAARDAGRPPAALASAVVSGTARIKLPLSMSTDAEVGEAE